MSNNPDVKSWLNRLENKLKEVEYLVDDPDASNDIIEDIIGDCKSYLENLESFLTPDLLRPYFVEIGDIKARVSKVDRKLHRRKNPWLLRLWRGFLSIFNITLDLPSLPEGKKK